MKIRTNIKEGWGGDGTGGKNHNEKMTSDKSKSLIVRTGLKAGIGGDPPGALNSNEKLTSDNKVKSLTVKTGVKAGEGTEAVTKQWLPSNF